MRTRFHLSVFRFPHGQDEWCWQIKHRGIELSYGYGETELACRDAASVWRIENTPYHERGSV